MRPVPRLHTNHIVRPDRPIASQLRTSSKCISQSQPRQSAPKMSARNARFTQSRKLVSLVSLTSLLHATENENPRRGRIHDGGISMGRKATPVPIRSISKIILCDFRFISNQSREIRRQFRSLLSLKLEKAGGGMFPRSHRSYRNPIVYPHPYSTALPTYLPYSIQISLVR
jgi:hypothetical protein